MNVVDEMGQAIGVVRAGNEPDTLYALRILQTTYRTHARATALVWHSDREENDVNQWAEQGVYLANVVRTPRKGWRFAVWRKSRKTPILSGFTSSAELARETCSLFVSGSP